MAPDDPRAPDENGTHVGAWRQRWYEEKTGKHILNGCKGQSDTEQRDKLESADFSCHQAAGGGGGGRGGMDTLTCPGDKLSVVPLNTSATLPTPGTVRHLHALHGRQELNSHRTGPTVSTAPALSWATLSSLSSSSLLLPSLAGI